MSGNMGIYFVEKRCLYFKIIWCLVGQSILRCDAEEAERASQRHRLSVLQIQAVRVALASHRQVQYVLRGDRQHLSRQLVHVVQEAPSATTSSALEHLIKFELLDIFRLEN